MPAEETLRGSTKFPSVHDASSRRYPSTAALSESDRHRVLSSARRRHVLAITAGRPSPVPLAALAAAVVAREDDAHPSDDETRDRVAVSLHHVHLPLLDEFGVLEYDTERREIEA